MKSNLLKKKNKLTKMKEKITFSMNMLAIAVVSPTMCYAAGASEVYSSSIDTLKIIVMSIGAALAVWGLVNLAEGYGNDNPGAKSQGVKQLMAGIGLALIGFTVVPKLGGMITLG